MKREGRVGRNATRWVAGQVLKRLVGPLAAWAAVSAAVATWSPSFLDRLDAGLLVQVLAPSAVALFALVLASSFVAAQTATSLYGARMALLIFSDRQLLACVGRLGLLVLLSVGLVLSCRRDGSAPELATATLVVLTVALAIEAFRAANDLAVAMSYATAPRIASGRIVQRAVDDLLHGVYGHVPWMAGTLGEMVQTSLRRGDGVGVTEASERLVALHGIWAIGAAEVVGWREPFVNHVQTSRGWLTNELCAALTRNVDEALRSLASADEIDRLTDALGAIALQAVEQGLSEEALIAVRDLTAAGTTANQVTDGVVNVLTQPAAWLADAERLAERELPEVAATALAGWALCMANVYARFNMHHPHYAASLEAMGPAPRWDDARQIIQSQEWQARWVNQLLGGTEFLLHVLDVAEANKRGEWGPPSAELFGGEHRGGFRARLRRWLTQIAMEERPTRGTLAFSAPRPLPEAPSASG